MSAVPKRPLKLITHSIWYKMHQIPKLKCLSPRLAVVFMQSVEARCQVENEDVVGATPTGVKVVGGYTGFTSSVCRSVHPSVCRRHGLWSISQVCCGISISNFIHMLIVAIGSSLLIFSDVTSKMAAWWPFRIFLFPDSAFNLVLNINSKVQ